MVLQTAGSLVAILALAGLAWWMKLGGNPRLGSEDAVHRAAGEVEEGFTPVAVTSDAEGRAALARDAEGRIMVIKRHGNRFAGRVLGPAAVARRKGETLAVHCGEALFGMVMLDLRDSAAWEEAINRLNGRGDA